MRLQRTGGCLIRMDAEHTQEDNRQQTNHGKNGSHYWFKMILSTHAVVGAALATLMPSHPVAAFVAGFASHFVIDSIPHWDYSLRSRSWRAGARNNWRISAARIRDLAVIGFDAFAGLALAVGIFGTKANMVAVLAGAVGGMLPDPLKLVYMLYPRQPLATLVRFHNWMHTKRKLDWPLGVSSQIAFASAVIGASVAVRLAT